MNWSSYSAPQDAMEAVLRMHFPLIDEESVLREAENLVSTRSAAYSFERVDRANKPPDKDQEHIRKAGKAIRSARNHLSEVGWHGRKTLSQVVLPLLHGSNRDFVANSGANSAAWEELLRIVDQLDAGLSNAAEEVNLDGKSVMTAFDDSPENQSFNQKKHSKTTAKYVSDECARIYNRLTGKKPTVPTRQIPHGRQGTSNEAYGPFLDFVADVLIAAEIDASPEVWAKAAAKEFSSSK